MALYDKTWHSTRLSASPVAPCFLCAQADWSPEFGRNFNNILSSVVLMFSYFVNGADNYQNVVYPGLEVGSACGHTQAHAGAHGDTRRHTETHACELTQSAK